MVRALATDFRRPARVSTVARGTRSAKPCAAWSAWQGTRKPIDIVLSRASLEPGIFGILRPVLIWPEGISKHLEDAHLEAILAHEVWHVRRRDNLAAALHMVVEAVFWFHPLVWWLGARMVEERERACDEEVVELGSERQVYAESILKVCEFCVGSPLACVSGVTGSDLKKRMVHIMTERIARKLDFGKKLLLSTAGVLALALPLVFGLVNAPKMRAQDQEQAATPGASTSNVELMVKSGRRRRGPSSGNDVLAHRIQSDEHDLAGAHSRGLRRPSQPDRRRSGLDQDRTIRSRNRYEG